jgi:hypothetical protein
MQRCIQSAFENFRADVGARDAIQPVRPIQEHLPVVSQDGLTLYNWGGYFSLLPHDYVLPCGGERVIWIQYMCRTGPPNRLIPPLKKVKGRHLPLATKSSETKKLSNLKYLGKNLESRIKIFHGDAYIQNPTVDEATAMYDGASATLFAATLLTGERRNQGEWTTIVKKMRQRGI